VSGDRLWTRDGDAQDGELGWAVTGVGDTDGDGYGDVAAGAPRACQDGLWAGRAYVFSGLSGTTLRSYDGDYDNGWFARDLTGGFDFNGDATGDLLVGAYAENDQAGTAYLYFLGYDEDGDGILAGCDNCAKEYNPAQTDANDDGVGDACQWMCGDADGNDIVNISDAVYLITYIFGGGPAPDPLLSGDCDCNQIVNISDAVYLITYIFGGGPAPCAACL
jgi:hypothetical protein